MAKKKKPAKKLVKKSLKKPVAKPVKIKNVVKNESKKVVPKTALASKKVKKTIKTATHPAKPVSKVLKTKEKEPKKLKGLVVPREETPQSEKLTKKVSVKVKSSVDEKKSKKKVEEEVLDPFEDGDDFGGEEIESPKEVETREREPESIVEEVVLTDAEGRRYCRVRECDQIASVDAYCRYHYLLFWKKIQVRKKILAEGKLERYIEELTSRYPDKYLEMLKKDLKTEKDFLAAIQELEIDESGGEGDFEDETQSYIDEVRGMSETGTTREEEDF
jgi:hypothetical protein